MINILISIKNPFYNEQKHTWKSLYQGSWPVRKHRVLEIGFFKYNYNLFEFNLDLRWSGHDHAGPEFQLNIFGQEFRAALPGNRHWDNEKNCWFVYKDENTK